ncbi:hypothetical protein P389DRAFT_19113 [Cystobasidium minutum MCA 4210]|uniref:uncharacterized protein n=1 Tax=Cystobasidium minutum MCA 4210 TaxID=1397322 RepID=UPI0034CFAD9C|eukprot:jgi/Rhomi1/19113/CE19112_609
MPPKAGVAGKRVAKELKEIDKELPDGIRAGLKNPDNLFEWYAQIDGPADSIYEGGVFDIDIVIPPDYPFRPPRAQFRTKVYHMNINSQGGICLDILKNQWSPALSVTKVILCILSLLTDPNPNDPLVGEIASLYRRDKKKHDSNAREWTTQYAKPEFAKPPVPVKKASTSASAKAIPAPSASSSSSSSSSSSATATAKANTTNAPKGKPTVIDLDDDDDDEDDKAASSKSNNINAAGRKRRTEESQDSSRPSSRPRLNGSSASGAATSANQVIELD